MLIYVPHSMAISWKNLTQLWFSFFSWASASQRLVSAFWFQLSSVGQILRPLAVHSSIFLRTSHAVCSIWDLKLRVIPPISYWFVFHNKCLPYLFPNNIFFSLAQSLFSNVAFGIGNAYLIGLEENGEGAQWSNIGSSPRTGDTFSLLECILMLLLDSVIYLIMTWYIETVFPGLFLTIQQCVLHSEVCHLLLFLFLQRTIRYSKTVVFYVPILILVFK